MCTNHLNQFCITFKTTAFKPISVHKNKVFHRAFIYAICGVGTASSFRHKVAITSTCQSLMMIPTPILLFLSSKVASYSINLKEILSWLPLKYSIYPSSYIILLDQKVLLVENLIVHFLPKKLLILGSQISFHKYICLF